MVACGDSGIPLRFDDVNYGVVGCCGSWDGASIGVVVMFYECMSGVAVGCGLRYDGFSYVSVCRKR